MKPRLHIVSLKGERRMIRSLRLNIELKIDHYFFKIYSAAAQENVEVYVIELNDTKYILTVKDSYINGKLSERGSENDKSDKTEEFINNFLLQKKLYYTIRNNSKHRIKLLTLFGPIKQLGDD